MEKTIQGKIDWIAEEPNEYPAGSGQLNLNMKIQGNFYNRDGEKAELESLRKKLAKGYEIKILVDGQKIQSIEVISDKVEKSEGKWEDDMVTFETLLTKAHELKKKFSIYTEMLNVDLEKKYALFKATVSIVDGDSIQTFIGHGDATNENVKGEHIKVHFIRMAETRAIVRALRWYTNNGCAEEEK